MHTIPRASRAGVAVRLQPVGPRPTPCLHAGAGGEAGPAQAQLHRQQHRPPDVAGVQGFRHGAVQQVAGAGLLFQPLTLWLLTGGQGPAGV